MKSAFARHEIPCEVISDNDPQYSSKEFESFTKQWEFKHTTTSPLYPQADGLVEKSVQTVKKLLTKAEQDNHDPYLGLIYIDLAKNEALVNIYSLLNKI